MDLSGDQDHLVRYAVGMMKRSSTYSVLLQNWREFSRQLGVSDPKIYDLQLKLNRETLQIQDLPYEILKLWKLQKGTGATMDGLRKALLKCNLNDIAECLCERRNFQFFWHEKLVTLEDLFGGNISSETYHKTFNLMMGHDSDQPFQLVKKELAPPPLPKYYVPRTLIYRASTELDPALFLSDFAQSHIFLFKGMNKADLARLTEYNAQIDESRNQLYNVTVKFILLESDGDFDRIAKITTKPTHVIEKVEQSYFWVKSSEGLDVIRKFLKDPGKPITEQEFASSVKTFSPPVALSIADSPGMGKTLLLANIARQLGTMGTCNNILFLFIVLHEFSKQLEQIQSSSSALQVIATYASCNPVAKSIITELLKSTNYQLYLLLGGYDEVMKNKLAMLDDFLRQLKKLKNVKVVVTTRPHLRTQLENKFNQFAYEIKPFDKSNQIDFLCNYWCEKNGTRRTQTVEQFAELCLAALVTKMDDNERTIAGIPLQCMMLGEVYAEDANRVSHLHTLPQEGLVQPNSLFEMYQLLMDLKFKKFLDEGSRRKHLNVHILFAIQTLFPEWSTTFRSHLNGIHEVDKDQLYSIGLMETSSNIPKFIHRTFAEYILAGFVVQNLRKRDCFYFLMRTILGHNGITIKENNDKACFYYELKYPVIMYFIEMHIKHHFVARQSISELLPSFGRYYFSTLDVCRTICACATNDLEYTFEFAINVVLNKIVRVSGRKWNLHFRNLPYVVVERSKSVAMLEKVLRFTKCQYNKVGSDNFSKLTPLHLAVFKGKYNMVQYLVQQYDNQATKVSCLLHECIRESLDNPKSVIEEKLLIIDLLVKINRNWLEQRDAHDCTPLLQQNAHFKLLQRLVEHGVDINACSIRKENILHLTNDKCNYLQLLKWGFSNRFALANQFDENNVTPLMHAIQKFGSVDEEVLIMFREKGVDIDLNCKDSNGDSILFLATERIESMDFIMKLLELGADVNHRNYKNQNVIHKVMQGEKGAIKERLVALNMFADMNLAWINEKDVYGCTPLLQENANLGLLQRLVELGADINSCSLRQETILHKYGDKSNFSDLLRWALSRGFNLIKQADRDGVTPLMHYVEICGTIEDEVLMIFDEQNADFNATDINGDSVLFYALANSLSVDFIKKLVLKHGANLHHKNCNKQNSAHVLLQGKLDSEGMLNLLKFFKSEGFTNREFRHRDVYGRTLLQIPNDKQLSKFLTKQIHTSSVLTPVFDRLCFGYMCSFIILKEDYLVAPIWLAVIMFLVLSSTYFMKINRKIHNSFCFAICDRETWDNLGQRIWACILFILVIFPLVYFTNENIKSSFYK